MVTWGLIDWVNIFWQGLRGRWCKIVNFPSSLPLSHAEVMRSLVLLPFRKPGLASVHFFISPILVNSQYVSFSHISESMLLLWPDLFWQSGEALSFHWWHFPLSITWAGALGPSKYITCQLLRLLLKEKQYKMGQWGWKEETRAAQWLISQSLGPRRQQLSWDFRVSTRESPFKQSVTSRQLGGGAVVVFLWREMSETLFTASGYGYPGMCPAGKSEA